MKPIFCGNFEYDARQSDLERLFGRYGKVDRVDMKSGFAFIYMEDERDAEDAIRALDRREFGQKGRRLRVEWTKQERGVRKPDNSASRRSSNMRPSKTLFVINFDPYHTQTRDLERHFDEYGKITSVRIRRNFAFIQYESQEDATKALEATNMSKLMDRVISVEYAVRDDDERRDGNSSDRNHDRSPDRRRRSPSPFRRERGSPDYGRGNGSGSSPYRRERPSPDYGRGRSPSPYRRNRGSPNYGRGSSRSPYKRERSGADHGHRTSRSTPRRERTNTDRARDPSHSPENDRGGASLYKKARTSPVNGNGLARSPYERERGSPDNDCEPRDSPSSIPEPKDSPNNYGGAESPMHERERYNSRSPAAEE